MVAKGMLDWSLFHGSLRYFLLFSAWVGGIYLRNQISSNSQRWIRPQELVTHLTSSTKEVTWAKLGSEAWTECPRGEGKRLDLWQKQVLAQQPQERDKKQGSGVAECTSRQGLKPPAWESFFASLRLIFRRRRKWARAISFIQKIRWGHELLCVVWPAQRPLPNKR